MRSEWLRWKLRVWGAKLHRNACESMMGVTRRNFEDDGGAVWWEQYRMYIRLYDEAVDDLARKISERPE